MQRREAQPGSDVVGLIRVRGRDFRLRREDRDVLEGFGTGLMTAATIENVTSRGHIFATVWCGGIALIMGAQVVYHAWERRARNR